MATPLGSNEERIACSILERHHSSLSQSMTSPYTVVRICQILYSKRCVDEPTLNDVESEGISLEDKKKLLLATVHLSVSDDHKKLHELVTVLEKFKETKSVANNIISDYNDEHLKAVKIAASEAMRNNIVDLDKALSVSFENIILTCEQEKLIPSNFKTNLLDPSTNNKATRCSNLITHIHNLVGVQPAHLDTFLCILNGKDLLASEVANSVAKSYGYNLPKYERIRGVGGATSVVSSDDNVEGMVPQMSNEDIASSDILRTHYSTLSQSLKDPVNIARLLHGENVISEDAFSQVESADTFNQTTVLLGLVRRAVSSNHQNLNKFGRVLGELAAGNERVGLDVLKDYDKAFPTKNTLDVNIAVQQPNTEAEGTAGTSDVHHITRDMEEEFSTIRGKFGNTLFKIERTLSKHGSTIVDDVKKFCKFTYPKCSLEIDDCRTMGDVLTFVAKKCTLINISILRELLNSCQIEEAKQHIESYQHDLDEFGLKMRVRFPLNQSLLPDGTPPPLRGETITFVIDRDPETTSLDDITDLQTYAFGKLAKHVKVIVSKKTNSIMITCSFPFDLTGLLIAEAMKNLKHLKKKHGLLRLTIGYCTIWNIRDEEEKEETTDVQSTNEKVTSERERELEQPLQGTHKLNEIISHKDKEVKELQEKVDLLKEQLMTEKRRNDAKEEMNEETVGDTSDDITDQQRDTESELVGQTDKTIEELQQPLQGKEDQTFPSQTTTPPSLSDTPSDKQMLKQQNKAMIMEIETLKSQLMKSKEVESEQIQQQLEDKEREIELLQEKISLQSIQSLDSQQHEREKYIKQLTSDIKELHSQNEKIKSLKEISDKVVSSVYSSLVKEVPPPDPNDTERERRVEWIMSGSDSVTLTSPTPSDCITLIRQISIDRRPCDMITLNSSSTDSTIILLSQLHQTNVKRLEIYDTQVTVEILQCLCHFIDINQLKYLDLTNTSLSTNGGLHLLTDAISTNTSLEELWLYNDRLTEDDMMNISQSLTINTTLQRLRLMYCNITDDGLVQLSNGLTHNRTLKELDIRDNYLITSTTAVCDIIHNSSLTHLYLYYTSLPSDSIPQLLDSLSTNNTIQRLWIDRRHREKCKQHENYQHLQDRLDFL